MTSYHSDRLFTNFIHKNLAIPKIYDPINWEKKSIDRISAEKMDIFDGIDYVFESNGELKTVQERFRERKYQEYTDFTIRYRRDKNPLAERHQSEYYKMKANYFTYGITNCLKNDMNTCSDFIKFAIVDLKIVYSKIESGDIYIVDSGLNSCRLVNNKIECPIKYNQDGSSSFFPIEISLLVKLWGTDVVLCQKGFI
jgi:hypothetical protein